MSIDNDKILQFAVNLINKAASENIDLKLLGGLAVFETCRKKQWLAGRPQCTDIDLLSKGDQNIRVNDFLYKIGFKSNGVDFSRFGEFYNYTQWSNLMQQNLNIEVYFGALKFNHDIPAPYFTKDFPYTLPIIQLLLSKLGIVELSKKDVLDISIILLSYPIISAGKESIDPKKLSKIFSNGIEGARLAKTCSLNLVKIRHQVSSLQIEIHLEIKLLNQITILEEILNNTQLSYIWKLKDHFGLEKKWYRDTQPRQVEPLQKNL